MASGTSVTPEALLHFLSEVEAAAANTAPANVLAMFQRPDITPQTVRACIHTTAQDFGQGQKPLELLLDLTMNPCMRLLEISNNAALNLQQVLDSPICVLLGALNEILTGAWVRDPLGVIRSRPIVPPAGRARLVKALLQAKFPKALVYSLASGRPKIAAMSFHVIIEMMFLPRVPDSELGDATAPLAEKKVCRAFLDDVPTLERMLYYVVPLASGDPQNDDQWAASLGCDHWVRLARFVRSGCAPDAVLYAVDDGFAENTIKVTYDSTGPCLTLLVSPNLGSGVSAMINPPSCHPAAKQAALGRICSYTIGAHASAGPDGFASVTSHRQVCGGCGCSGAERRLLACTRCRKVWYCGKECQTAHWKEHKPDCKQ